MTGQSTQRATSPGRRFYRVRGFVLAVALLLLAFIGSMLGLFAIATRVESQESARAGDQARARHIAQAAFHLALAQLQENAGPDRRVTASADAWHESNQRYTGVWDAAGTAAGPLTWLVSGNDRNDPLRITPSVSAERTVELVGRQTSGVQNGVVVPLEPMHAGYGAESSALIGRYGWWVGDQGVKASVASPDRLDAVKTPPFDVDELRGRIRQRVTLGCAVAAFDPRDPRNRDLIPNILRLNQVAFLRDHDGALLTTAMTRSNFHVWSPLNRAVLAVTTEGGLRKDLSLKPEFLGSAFAAWADYSQYMENPTGDASAARAIPEITSSSSLRRRYRLTSRHSDRGIVAGVAPVLVLALLNFDCRTVNGVSSVNNIESRLRWIIGLWNPYSAAFVPENLRVEISGLPTAVEFAASSNGATQATISLADLFGEPLKLSLPWASAGSGTSGRPDASSWLPGRVYYWTSIANTSEPPGGNVGLFYSKSLIGSPSRVMSRVAAAQLAGSSPGGWRVRTTTVLTARLFREGEDTPLATYRSPSFEPFFATDPVATPRASSGSYEFSFFFRLDQNRPIGDAAWLVTAERDPRSVSLPATAFVSGSQGPVPSAYPGVPAITNDDLLLERAMAESGQSYNEDVPVFELPRTPVLSVGELQHLHVAGGRPFSIGNPWGSDGGWNAVFDRYFFSGLNPKDSQTNDLAPGPLPSPLLSIIRHDAAGSIVRIADLRSEAEPDRRGLSSKFLLQDGAFNVNSTSVEAWTAAIRGTRFRSEDTFVGLDASQLTGTAGDAEVLSVRGSFEAAVFRFSQSAGETFKAEPGKAAGISGPFNPDPSTVANTHLYRRGLRILTKDDIAKLGSAIAGRVRTRLAAKGPFRSLEQFLDEAIVADAIADSGVNDSVGEFSSQWLTQADLITALAPTLFARTDTFLIRAYGEAVNSATGDATARAWCEAQVQRYPEPFAPLEQTRITDEEYQEPPGSFGRRFKVVSFRWLSAGEI